jgi:hypothetical protein
MILVKRCIALGILSLCTMAPALSAREAELPEVTEDGLHRVHDSKLAIVYAEPGADLAPYQRVLLLDAYVAFKKNWARDQRRSSIDPLKITSQDVERIKNDLAQGFHEVFGQTLEEGGYELAEGAGEDVLLVRPAIINLDVNAPDTMSAGSSHTYTDSAGEMTLYIELYDSVTGDLIAKALDRRIDRRNSGFYTWSNRATNRAAAERIMKGWASILVAALDEARASTSTAGNEGENGS